MSSESADCAGHVFVVRGDLRNFACSAWMLTTDRALRPEGKWLQMIPDAAERIDSADRAAFQAEQLHSIPVRPRVGEPGPIAYLTAVPYSGIRSVDEFRPRIRAFVERATVMGNSMPLPGRSRLLLAIPPIGTG